MSTGTALVHPDTAKLTPDAQKKGTYHYTPPEVLAFNNGESLSDGDLEIVRKFYGGVIPNITPGNGQNAVSSTATDSEIYTRDKSPSFDYQPQRRVEAQPALAAPYGQRPTKLVKKRKSSDATPLDAAYVLAAALNDDDAYSLLCHLAGRFDLDIE